MTAQAFPARKMPLDLTQWRTRYLGPVILLLLSVRVVIALIWLALTLPVEWELSFPEGAVVARAVEVARGQTPYHDWREYPHHFAPYGPATYYPVGWLARLIAPEDDRLALIEITRLVGRAQSLVFLAGLLALTVALLRRLGLGWGWSLLGLAAALSWEKLSGDLPFMSLFGYTASYRPDAPQAFFSLLALWVALGGSARSMRRTFVVFACLYVSFWFKATPWGMLGALAFWVMRGAGVHRGTMALLLFALAGLVPVMILNYVWDGRFLLNLIGSLNNGIDSDNLALIFSRLTFETWFVFMFGIFVVFLLWTRALMESREFLFALATLTTLAATLAVSLKVGADINYFLELHILLSVATVFGVHRLWRMEPLGGVSEAEPDPSVELRRELPLSVLLLPFLLYTSGYALLGAHRDLIHNPQLWRKPVIAERVQEYPGPVLSVTPWIGLIAPGETSVLDYFQYRVLADRGLLDRNLLLDRIREGRFAAIIIEGTPEQPSGEFYTRDFIEILNTYYRPAEDDKQMFMFTLYVPDEDRILRPPDPNNLPFSPDYLAPQSDPSLRRLLPPPDRLNDGSTMNM